MTDIGARDRWMAAGFVLAAGALSGIFPQQSFAYEPNCNGQFEPTVITSVFDEPRASSSTPTVPNRFHAGVDIVQQCAPGAVVGAIEGGNVSTVNAYCRSGTVNCVRVTNPTTGHAFDYEHVLWTGYVTSTMTVVQGQALGVIGGTQGNHLHLNEIIKNGSLSTRINPQFSGHLLFTDADRPTFVAVTVGAVTDKIILIKSGTESAPQVANFFSGKYYASGDVDIFVTARDGSNRKGIYTITTDAEPIWAVGAALPLPSGLTQIFAYLNDGPSTVRDVQTIYYQRNPDPGGSDTFIPTNLFTGGMTPQAAAARWVTALAFQGDQQICATAQDHPQPSAHLTTPYCVDVVVDNIPPVPSLYANGSLFTGATSYNIITVQGDDSGSGTYTLNLVGPGGYNETSTNSAVSTTYSANFPLVGGTLADGAYTATVTDLAGNSASVSFTVDSSGSNTSNNSSTSNNVPISSSTVGPGQCLVARASNSVSGIKSISFGGNGVSTTTANFSCQSSAAFGPFCNLAIGTFTVTATSCSGIQNSYPVQSSNPTGNVTFGFSVNGNPLNYTSFGCSHYQGSLLNVGMDATIAGNPATLCGVYNFPPGGTCTTQWTGSGSNYIVHYRADVPASTYDFTVANTTTNTQALSLVASLGGVGLNNGGSGGVVSSYSGHVTVPECGVVPFSPVVSSNNVASVTPFFVGTQVTAVAPTATAFQSARANVRSVMSGWYYQYFGSGDVFVSTAPISFTYQPPSGILVDTATLAIYAFDGASWSTGSITNQSVSESTSGVIVASGTITGSGLYAAFFDGHDSSAPVTTFSIQGSSFVFDQTLFVSTYSYAVLTATDPMVNGFASQVASITYAIDPSSGGIFSVYNSSIPLPLGTHVFQYRSYDYAGNAEAINTTTLTVTAGTAFKEQSDDSIAGSLLVGFLGSGAQAEVVARAQDAMTLQVSSANHQPILGVTNIGSVGVGVPAPFGQLDIGSSSTALQLKSGNLTSTGTSVQAAFGYNGDVAMRHAIRTFHSTNTVSNEMDFLVWTPDAGSTTTIATKEFLALQASSTSSSGGSMHVLPVGVGDVELEVSNGLATGGGTMQRLQVLTPSSKRFKSDIRYLKEKDEDRALEQTAALKHVRFRYRSRAMDGSLYDDPGEQVRVGLIYEEAPDSIRGAGQTLLTNERLANVELALRSAIRKLELLEKRYQKLKARQAK